MLNVDVPAGAGEDDYTILDAAWPQRMLCRIEHDGQLFYVWADCEDDACDSVEEYLEVQGISEGLVCDVVRKGDEYAKVKAATDAYLAAL